MGSSCEDHPPGLPLPPIVPARLENDELEESTDEVASPGLAFASVLLISLSTAKAGDQLAAGPPDRGGRRSLHRRDPSQGGGQARAGGRRRRTLVRRLTLDLAGRIPRRLRPGAYIETTDPEKQTRLMSA